MAPLMTSSNINVRDYFQECDCHDHRHPNIDEIYPNLFLGKFVTPELPLSNSQLTNCPINSLSAAQSAETLEEYGITHIISVASRPPSIPEELHIKHKYYEIHDDHKADLLAVLPEAVLRLDWILKNGDCGLDGKGGRSKVLVHCCMGKSRSGAVVVGYGLSLLCM